MSKKTPWFKANVKPYRFGLYEVNRGFGVEILWWSCLYWYFDADDCMRRAEWTSRCRWRGLTKPSKAAA